MIFVLTLSIVVVLGLGALTVIKTIGNKKERPSERKASADRNTVTEEPGRPFFSAIPEPEMTADSESSGAMLSEVLDEWMTEDMPESEAGRNGIGQNSDLLSSRHSGVVRRFGDDLDDPEYLAANNIFVLESRDDDTTGTTLTFAGDILFDDEYSVYARLLTNGGAINAGIDQQVINIMKTSDIMMVNNEFPYTLRGEPTPDKTYTFRADPDTVHLIRDMGANAVGIANNHAYDFGPQGFLDTLDTLDDAGIPYTGGGHNIQEASAPLYFVVDDFKVGIIAATQIERLDNPDTKGATDTDPGVFRCLNPKRLLGVVGEMKDKCDFVVVFIHWGTESTTELDWLQTDQAPMIAEAGADLIIGSHPHVLQPIGRTKGVPVVYSLGNFWFNSKELDTGLVQACVTTEGMRSLRFIPCRQVGCKTYLAQGEEFDRILKEMRAMSPGVKIDDRGYITY